MTTESGLYKYVKREAEKRGVLCYKLSTPSHRGIPDVLLIGKGKKRLEWAAEYIFIELKSPKGTGRLSPLQAREIEKLSNQGCEVYVCNNHIEIDRIIDALTVE